MNIYEKLLKVQTDLKAPKNKHNSYGGFNYRSCEDILEAVKPILKEVKASVYIQDSITEHNDRIYVMAMAYFVDVEKPETPHICVTAFAREPLVKKGMDESQITGTASSYARKYALNGLFLIDDVKDADTDEYQKTTEKTVLDEYIDAKQCTKIEQLLVKAGIKPEKFCQIYGITMIPELPSKKFNEATKKLEEAIKAKGV